MSFPVGNVEACRRIGGLALLALGVLASGCGSSESGQFSASGSEKVLKTDDIYRPVGKGKNKQKVSLSRNERFKARFEANKKLEGE